MEAHNGVFIEPIGFTRDNAWETLIQVMMFEWDMSPTWSPAGGTVGTVVEPSGSGALLEEVHLWDRLGFLAIPHFLFSVSWV